MQTQNPIPPTPKKKFASLLVAGVILLCIGAFLGSQWNALQRNQPRIIPHQIEELVLLTPAVFLTGIIITIMGMLRLLQSFGLFLLIASQKNREDISVHDPDRALGDGDCRHLSLALA